MSGEQLNQEGLTEIVNVFLRRFIGNAEQIRHLIVVDRLACIVDEMMGKFTKCLDITYVEAFLGRILLLLVNGCGAIGRGLVLESPLSHSAMDMSTVWRGTLTTERMTRMWCGVLPFVL